MRSGSGSWPARAADADAGTTGKRSRRAGTENVTGIVGMGVAARFARGKMAEKAHASRRCATGSRRKSLPRFQGPPSTEQRESRVPNTTNVSFDRVEAESLLIALDLEGIAVVGLARHARRNAGAVTRAQSDGFNAHRAQNSIRSVSAREPDAEIDRVSAVRRDGREAAKPHPCPGKSGDKPQRRRDTEKILGLLCVSVPLWPVE